MTINKTTVIAEAGVNHNGNADMAFALVDAAVAAGADIVKFQTFKADQLVTRKAPQAAYQVAAIGESSQYEMLKRLELSEDLHFQLIDYCKANNIRFLSTAFDHVSLDFLVQQLQLDTLKIPSGEITNGPLVLAYARSGANLIISTGMATLQEVADVLGIVAYGFTDKSGVSPNRDSLLRAIQSEDGQAALRQKVILLHCTTEYPAPFDEINLRAMDTLAREFGLTVGYSDHSEGITIPIAAVARGATLIEKHFTLDKTLVGPDHRASLEPDELTAMISAIRTVEASLGDGIKMPTQSERGNLVSARKSLIAANDIAAGDLLTADNISIKRPGGGISPMAYWDILGTRSSKAVRAGDYIDD